MSTLRPVEIAGGGLAGLSLGLALRGRGVPVTVFEAGEYPRHRVCGEFISGLDTDTCATLGLSGCLADARQHRTTAWFHQGRAAGTTVLPEPALGLSRQVLDRRLAEAFCAAGGELRVRSRLPLEPLVPGRVTAAGRVRGPSRWLGLKLHVQDLALAADLELHLGRGAYVGACRVEGRAVNVCGLFRPQPSAAGDPATVLIRHLRAAGIDGLADRIEESETDPDSVSAVAAVHFGAPVDRPGGIAIGDAYAMIPPFTGHGMTIAFQSAATVVGPLVAWSRGEAEWSETARRARRALDRRFRRRLAVARALHGFLLGPAGQRGFVGLLRTRLLPFRLLYRLLR